VGPDPLCSQFIQKSKCKVVTAIVLPCCAMAFPSSSSSSSSFSSSFLSVHAFGKKALVEAARLCVWRAARHVERCRRVVETLANPDAAAAACARMDSLTFIEGLVIQRSSVY